SAINIHKLKNDQNTAVAPREYPEVSIFAWPTSSLCQQPSATKKNSVSIVPATSMLVSGYISAQFEVYITGKFTISYIINDNTNPEPTLKYYLVTARIGQKILLLNETHVESGEYSITVNAPV
ncbi:hypothetical protein, partial [Salmonella sp. s51228]|uniref:hypothetical protein n=1 Tax=Salmonella sp. s51228 TaxID=3159652 RepID=UPI003980CA5C